MPLCWPLASRMPTAPSSPTVKGAGKQALPGRLAVASGTVSEAMRAHSFADLLSGSSGSGGVGDSAQAWARRAASAASAACRVASSASASARPACSVAVAASVSAFCAALMAFFSASSSLSAISCGLLSLVGGSMTERESCSRNCCRSAVAMSRPSSMTAGSKRVALTRSISCVNGMSRVMASSQPSGRGEPSCRYVTVPPFSSRLAVQPAASLLLPSGPVRVTASWEVSQTLKENGNCVAVPLPS